MGILSAGPPRDRAEAIRVLRQIQREIRESRRQLERGLNSALETQDRSRRIYHEGEMTSFSRADAIIARYIADLEARAQKAESPRITVLQKN